MSGYRFHAAAKTRAIGVLLVVALLAACFGTSAQINIAIASRPGAPWQPNPPAAKRQQAPARVILDGVTAQIVPADSNIWKCACDTDGCWPGCFTVASATILEYWAKRGYPALWDADTNGTLQRLRDLFPNLFCYNNVDADGKPGESGYDAFDVAKGFGIFIEERGYRFNVKPVPGPSFEQIVAEIDAGRPVIGAFGRSPWGSHAGTIIGYDTTDGKRVMIVRPNLSGKLDTELSWGVGYGEFGIVTIEPTDAKSVAGIAAQRRIEVVVDDFDADFVMRGDWRTIDGFGFAGATRLITTTATTATFSDTLASASWTPKLPVDGLYDVAVFVPRVEADPGELHVATYQVAHAEGASLVRRSVNTVSAGWMSLGVFPMSRGAASRVSLENNTGDAQARPVYADAVRFIYKEPLIVKRQSTGALAMIVDGKLREFRDLDTITALKLKVSRAREIDDFVYTQYQRGDPMPSLYSAWVGQFFDGEALIGPTSWVRGDPALNFEWGGAAPMAGLNGRAFAARWSRTMALTEGDYPFVIQAVGGVRLWIDGKLVIDAWDDDVSATRAHNKTVSLLSGLHRVDVDYVNRGGYGQIKFGNLPPNAPVVIDSVAPNTETRKVELRWLDAGDPDNALSARPRRYFATLWREDGYRVTSGWLTATQWLATLPADGRYLWSVVASDGAANSASTTARPIVLDRTPPWSQMLSAEAPMTRVEPGAAAANKNLRVTTGADGTQIVIDAGPASQAAAPTDEPVKSRLEVSNRALHQQFGDAPVVKLSWWATDTLGMDGARFVLQARETVRARTEYTLTSELREVARVGYALTLSGTREITQAVTLTETVLVTDVAPIVSLTPISNAEWITVSAALPVTETVFVGVPGGTFEFRVRAIDGFGNEQRWHDGYAIAVKFDEDTRLPAALKPFTIFPVGRTEPISNGVPLNPGVSLTDTLALSATTLLIQPPAGLTDALTAPITSTFLVSIAVTTAPSDSVPVLKPMPTISVDPTGERSPDGLVYMPTVPVDGGGQPVPGVTATPTLPPGLVYMPTIPAEVINPIVPTATPQPTAIPIATDTPVPSATPQPTEAPPTATVATPAPESQTPTKTP